MPVGRLAVCCAFGLSLASIMPVGRGGATPAKTLRVALSIAETTFDPAFASDAASDDIIANVFDAMLDYDYLARPVKLVPRALEAMPLVEDGGKTYLCKVRKGVYFTPDPAFKGRPRELTAADFAYGIKRILDPAVKSPWLWLIEGKLLGGDAARAKAAKSGRFDYDAPIAGLEVVDRYTLRIRLDAAGPALPVRARDAERRGAGARSRRGVRRRHRRASGRHRSVHARRIPAQHADRAGREPVVSRDRVTSLPARYRHRRRPVAAALKGKLLPLGRPRRDQRSSRKARRAGSRS